MSKRQHKHDEGMALILAFMAIAVILGAISLVMTQVHSAKRSTDFAVNNVLIDEACKAGVDLAAEQLWNQYIINEGNTTGNVASYRYYVESVLGIPNNEDLNHDGQQNEHEKDLNGDNNFDVADPYVIYDPENDGDDLLLGDDEGNAAVLTGLTIERTDDVTGSDFIIRSTARLGGEERTVRQKIRISGAPFHGYEYVVLANNINCILCHAEITNYEYTMAKEGGGVDGEPIDGSSNLLSPYKRVKVASLETLLFRRTEANSNAAGTVYTRGEVYNTNGSPMSDSSLADSGTKFKGYLFDDKTGQMIVDSSGNLIKTSFEVGDNEEPLHNFYKNYPQDQSEMVDGILPQTFPAPYPDDNENRYVEDDEYHEVAGVLEGGVSGGVIFGVPEGDVYGDDSLPDASNEAAASITSGYYDGNVIMVGTESNPIRLDGEVAIDGDLVITGKVEGKGQLFVRGNTYMVGDVTYNDAPGEYGVAADGTQNALALVSGGSVLIGDYLTVRGKNHTADTSKYPNHSYSIRCREEHVTKDWTKDGVTQTMNYGYFDPGVIDAGEITDVMYDEDGTEIPRDGNQFSFTQSELCLFNNMELEKAIADPTYTPRFYGLRESQPNNIYVYHKGTDEHAVRYDEKGGGVQLIQDYMIQEGYDLSILDRAAVHYMNPDGGWLSEETLRKMWFEDEMSRDSRDRWRFDGLMYSNNAIFCITQSWGRHKSHKDGKMRIRGAVICPDLGVLVPTKLELCYDQRVRQFWTPEDTTQVAFQRQVFLREYPECEATEG